MTPAKIAAARSLLDRQQHLGDRPDGHGEQRNFVRPHGRIIAGGMVAGEDSGT